MATTHDAKNPRHRIGAREKCGGARGFAPVTKRGRKPFFDAAIFQERFNTIERVFGWEDKFRRLLLRFERISQLHYAFKSLAYSMINLRHFC